MRADRGPRQVRTQLGLAVLSGSCELKTLGCDALRLITHRAPLLQPEA